MRKILNIIFSSFLFLGFPGPAFSATYTGYQGVFLNPVSTTIASSGTKSAVIKLNGFVLAGISLPTTFTGSTITFEACDTAAGTFQVVKSSTSGTTLSYTVTQNTFVVINPADFYGINFLKIVSGSTEGATRTLKLSLKGL